MEVKREGSVADEEGVNGRTEQGLNVSINNSERSSEETASKPSSSDNSKDKNTINHESEELESMKAEMGEVREENERLKTTMARIVKDYQSLQMHFFSIVHERQLANNKKPVETITPPPHQEIAETELVLGRIASGQKKEEIIKAPRRAKTREEEDEQMKELNLGLDCRFDIRSGNGSNEVNYSPNLSPEHSFEETKEEEAEAGRDQPWRPSKVLKSSRDGDYEATDQQNRVVKKARVSVRAKCDAPTMNDGCQWRKYGQKIAKGNPCPRAYYRCTVSPACPVRKQVQRCADDKSILITTYEGTHNHPLPISATAMASTTSAAACMLRSGSSASQPAINGAPTTPGANFHVLNSSQYLDYTRPRQFYLPNPSISPSPSSYPTITLDLTSPPACSSSSAQLNKLSTNYSSTPSYSSTSLKFSDSTTCPASWSNGYLSYGSQAYNNKSLIGSFDIGRQSQEPAVYQYYMQKTMNSVPPAPIQHSLTDTIAAATKAITSDPSFQSALAAAITSIVGGQGTQSI